MGCGAEDEMCDLVAEIHFRPGIAFFFDKQLPSVGSTILETRHGDSKDVQLQKYNDKLLQKICKEQESIIIECSYLVYVVGGVYENDKCKKVGKMQPKCFYGVLNIAEIAFNFYVQYSQGISRQAFLASNKFRCD